jgi:GT2 family glycosyltransferase
VSDTPRFSVVIPAYNAAATIGETIGSVLAQSERDLELIVVDDGSTDETPTLVRELARDDDRLDLVEQPNAGTAGARNTGLRRASGQLVAFVDNDDLWMPTYLAEMASALEARPDAGFAYCDAWVLDHARLRLRRVTELQSRPPPPPSATREEVLRALARENFVMSSTTIRRDVLLAADGFSLDVRGTDDYDLWLRIVLAGHTAVRAGAQPLLIQRDRSDSQSKDFRHMDLGLRAVLERVIHDERTPADVSEICAARLRAIDRQLEPGLGGRLRRAAAALYLRAALTRDRVLPNRVLLEHTPPAVAAAFPHLEVARTRGSR